ncbi:MAG: hypothetical protein LC793_24255 [Thermomicrobia bacterium]|nr:hypothetical protein [Thermomicrobia bacterium]
MLGEQFIEKTPLYHVGLARRRALRQVGYRDPDTGPGRADVHADRAVRRNRFLDKEHTVLPRATAEKMLRALIDKIPAQMRQDNNIKGGALIGRFREEAINRERAINRQAIRAKIVSHRWVR